MNPYLIQCFVIRFEGQLSVDAVTDWFATTVLGLPRILYYSKESLVNWRIHGYVAWVVGSYHLSQYCQIWFSFVAVKWSWKILLQAQSFMAKTGPHKVRQFLWHNCINHGCCISQGMEMRNVLSYVTLNHSASPIFPPLSVVYIIYR